MVTIVLAAAAAAPLFWQEAGAGRLLWRRTHPDSAIYLPTGYKDGTNQQVVGVVTPRKTFVVVWTIGSRESMADHRLVVSRSNNLGQTWSPPLVLDSEEFDRQGRGDGRRAQYGFPFVVPSTGRVYVFYNKNTGQNQVRPDITGVLKYQYSDDDGTTWKPGGVLPIARGEFSHPDPKADPNFIGIYAPILTSKGSVIAGAARYKAGPDLHQGIPYQEWETELIFFRFDNILTERDATKLTMTTLPRGSRGLRVPRLDDPAKVWSNEPSLIELSDRRLLAAIRTRNNAVYYAVSADQGETWSQPQPLRFTNGGAPIPNPSAPCPIVRLKDGRVALMFYNQPIDQGPFGKRDPVYLAAGRETLAKPQPVEFGAPREFMNIGGQMVPGGTAWPQIASYSSFLEFEDKLYLFYNDCKYFVLFKEAPPHLLGERARPQASAAADWRNIARGHVIPDEGYSDQPYVVVTNDGNWLCVLTTGKGIEGQAGQHIAATISSDRGKTWSPLIDIEPAAGPEASWAMPLKVPSGRVYVFYTYNKDNIREVPGIASEGIRRRVDTLGGYMFKYSDDHGRTWSKERYEIPMRLMQIDRDNNFAGRTLLFWGVGKPFIHGAAAYFGFSKVGKQGLPGTFVRSQGCIMRSDNILRERDPKKIRWELLPAGDEGLRAPKGPIAEETNLAALSDGALSAFYRTIDGYLCHAYSRDRGRTWTGPEYATYTPGGRRIKNPRAFGLVRRFSNGKYLLWYHNHGGEPVHLKSWDYYRERNPGWVAGSSS